MATTRERIEQAEESVAQLQTVLDHTQSALAVAEQVEVAARKSRRLLKVLLVIAVVGIVVAVIMKVASSRSESREEAPGDRDGARTD